MQVWLVFVKLFVVFIGCAASPISMSSTLQSLLTPVYSQVNKTQRKQIKQTQPVFAAEVATHTQLSNKNSAFSARYSVEKPSTILLSHCAITPQRKIEIFEITQRLKYQVNTERFIRYKSKLLFFTPYYYSQNELPRALNNVS